MMHIIKFCFKETLHIYFLTSFQRKKLFETSTNHLYVVDTKQIANVKSLEEANNAR